MYPTAVFQTQSFVHQKVEWNTRCTLSNRKLFCLKNNYFIYHCYNFSGCFLKNLILKVREDSVDLIQEGPTTSQLSLVQEETQVYLILFQLLHLVCLNEFVKPHYVITSANLPRVLEYNTSLQDVFAQESVSTNMFFLSSYFLDI